MRQENINIYKYDELSEEAKQKAVEGLSDINTDYDWWKYVYEDAKQVGIEITEFDIDRRNIKGNIFLFPRQVKKLILKNHGKECRTYKTVDGRDLRTKFGSAGFTYELLQDYLFMLTDSYEDAISKESIIETVRCNDYEFTVDGELY